MIRAIKEGDSFAFEELYVQSRRRLYNYFLKKTNSSEDAKDLVQVTFVKLWQYRASLSEDYLPEQQLFYIARTAFIDYLRKENKLQKIKTSLRSKIDNEPPANPPDEFAVQAGLQKALSGMPVLRKQVFELHKIHGYSYKEIAEMLSIPVKSVDNNLSKALKFLRNAELIIIFLLPSIFH
jgi:RNA polymerase sigma factor (sigma-70 family)